MSEYDMQTAGTKPVVKPFPGIWLAVGWVVLFIFAQIAASMAFILPHLDLSQDVPGVLAQMADVKRIALPSIQAVVAANLFIIALFAYYTRRPDRRAALGLDHWGKDGLPKTLRLAGIMIIAALAFNIAYTVLVGANVEMQKALRDMLAAIPQTPLNMATILFATVILAPIAEELVFRGMLQKSLSHRLPIWAAIGISALIFSIMHGDLNSAPALFVIGGIFGLLYHLTGSLRLTIVAHLTNNLVAMLAANFV
jgi:membrane protease YdiL (CAAX protease family)